MAPELDKAGKEISQIKTLILRASKTDTNIAACFQLYRQIIQAQEEQCLNYTILTEDTHLVLESLYADADLERRPNCRYSVDSRHSITTLWGSCSSWVQPSGRLRVPSKSSSGGCNRIAIFHGLATCLVKNFLSSNEINVNIEKNSENGPFEVDIWYIGNLAVWGEIQEEFFFSSKVGFWTSRS